MLKGKKVGLEKTEAHFGQNRPKSAMHIMQKLRARARKLRITRISDFGQFWPIFAQKCLGFSEHTFIPLSTSTSHFQGSINNARGAFEPKTPPGSPL